MEPGNDAVDHYHRYAEDIQLSADVGCNAYGFRIEWEPEERHFDEEKITRYRRVPGNIAKEWCGYEAGRIA